MKLYSWLLDVAGLSAVQAQALSQRCLHVGLVSTDQLAERKAELAEIMQEVDLDEWEAMSLITALGELKVGGGETKAPVQGNAVTGKTSSSAPPLSLPQQIDLADAWPLIIPSDDMKNHLQKHMEDVSGYCIISFVHHANTLSNTALTSPGFTRQSLHRHGTTQTNHHYHTFPS